MRILLEMFLYLSVMLPIFHMINAIPKNRRSRIMLLENIKEQPITILVPCFNEEVILKNTIEGMLRINYTNFKCVFINDGSDDLTLDVLKRMLMSIEIETSYPEMIKTNRVRAIYQSILYPNFYIIDKDNGGKGDSLNAGINFTTTDIIVTLDADCVLKTNALKYMNQTFKLGKTVAASGVIHILQSYKLTRSTAKLGLHLPIVLKIQTIEYIKACYTYKASLCKMKALPVISGAFGVFDKNVLIELGGYHNTVGEDIDITLRIQFYIQSHKDKEIIFVSEAVCYTEGPESWSELIKQRTRWQKAFIDCLVIYRRRLIKNMFSKSLSFFMIFDGFLVGTFSTIVYSSSYFLVFAGIFLAKYNFIYMYYIVSLCVHLSYNIVSLIISRFYKITFAKEDILNLIFTILFDVIIYRFLVIVFVFKGTIGYFFNRQHWDKVARSGRDYMVLKKVG